MAKTFGFAAVGISTPELAAKFAANFAQWLAAGHHGTMAWMAEPSRVRRRRAPQTMLPGVQTVISLAMRYSPPPYALDQALAATDRGIIAAYAHGDDYHEVMKKRLKAFARALDQMLGRHDQRVYVDTAPVLEHAFAEQGGLAWQGKHSLSLNRQLGSWFLLGEVFTTAKLSPDAPATAHCGSCTACLDMCPTRAIVRPFFVDARRCIAYLTIEHKGRIPQGLRPLFGNRIYGCDDCQMVCPWNRDIPQPQDDLLKPRGENCLPKLASLLALDEDGFRSRFRKSPIRRTGRDAFLRNVCIALGNSRRADALPPLASAIRDVSPLVRGHAAWAIGCLPVAPESRQRLLLQARRREHEPFVRTEIDDALARIQKE